MRIDFCVRLKTLKGLPMFEKSFETMVISKATKLASDKSFANFEEIAAVFDKEKISWSALWQEEGVPLCLKDICVEALMLKNVSFSEVLPGREFAIRYKLSTAIMDAKEPLSVKPSEVRLMQELIGKLPPQFGPLVAGQALLLLEAGEPEESDKDEPPVKLKEPQKEPQGRIPSRRN